MTILSHNIHSYAFYEGKIPLIVTDPLSKRSNASDIQTPAAAAVPYLIPAVLGHKPYQDWTGPCGSGADKR